MNKPQETSSLYQQFQSFQYPLTHHINALYAHRTINSARERGHERAHQLHRTKTNWRWIDHLSTRELHTPRVLFSPLLSKGIHTYTTQNGNARVSKTTTLNHLSRIITRFKSRARPARYKDAQYKTRFFPSFFLSLRPARVIRLSRRANRLIA